MKTAYSILFLCQISILLAQDCKLRGTVLDSLALPVYDASISAFNSENKGEGFTYTDINGEFVLDLPCNDDYELEVEHVSYESFSKKERLDKSKRVQYILNQSVVDLEEAVVKAKVPIKIKGDTIEYDADFFKTGSEENLEDILKKIPGIEVENGKVYHQGKEITSITVEGREIFGGNTKLLNKNLPSEVVDKIQLNKKFKRNPFGNSLQGDEQPALNITLKEDKKSLIFGNVTIGGDSDEHSDLQEKLFYFSPKTDATLITDFNTYGKEVFSNEDYFSFLGGISEFQEEGSSYALRESSTGLNLGSTQNANNINNFLSAVHFGYEPSKKLYMNGFALINNNAQSYKTIRERVYDFGNIVDTESTDQSLFSGLSRLRLDYSPSSKAQFKYRMNLNYLENQEEQDVRSTGSLIQGESFREILSDRKSVSVQQKLSYIRKIGEDHNLGIYLRHKYQKETPDWMVNSTVSPFSIFNLTAQNNRFNINQEQELSSQTLQLYSIYNHLITNTSNLRIKLGSNFTWQDFENDIVSFQQPVETNNSISDISPISNSDFNFTQLYIDLTYTKKWNQLTMDAGSGLHYFRDQNNGINSQTNIDIVRALPHLNLKYEINSNENFNFNYTRDYTLPQVKELTDSYQIQNYFSIFRGNQDLKRALFDKLSLSYGIFNSYKFFNFYARIGYNIRTDNYQNASIVQQVGGNSSITQINRTINSPRQEDSWNSSFFMSKRFSSKYSIRVRGNINYSDYFTFVQLGNSIAISDLSLVNNRILSQNYNLRNTYKFKKKVEFNLGLNLDLSDFETQQSNKFTNWRPFTDIAYQVNKKLLFQAEYSYEAQFNNGDFLNGVNSLNASIRFKPIKKTYIKLIGGNLLGNDQVVNNSFGNNFTQISTREVLGRYIILNVRFKF